MDLIKVAENAFAVEAKEQPQFKAGDTITVHYKIKEGNKGLEIQRRDEKTKDYEVFPVSEQARELINYDSYVKHLPDSKVFPDLHYKTMTDNLKRILSVLRLSKKITWHTSRRTYAVMLLSNGVDIYTVSKLLGHADLQTTQLYSNIISDTKQRAVDSLQVLTITK